MKIKNIAAICKKNKTIVLFEKHSESGDTVIQYIGDGGAAYLHDHEFDRALPEEIPLHAGKVIRKVRRRSKNNMKRKLKKFAGLKAAGKIDQQTIEQSYQSWRGHASKGNCYHLIRRTDQYYKSLFGIEEKGDAAPPILPCGEIPCRECPYYHESYFCGYISEYCDVFGSFENL